MSKFICGFNSCEYCADGICINEVQYNFCEYKFLKSLVYMYESELLKLLDKEENNN